MESHEVKGTGLSDWQAYAEVFDFVADPMLLRAGEIFLNGRSGAERPGVDEFALRDALHNNVAGVIDFFDLLVTRDTIPLINYHDTFGHETLAWSLPTLLPDQVREVTVRRDAYQRIKAGAIRNLSMLDFDQLGSLAGQLGELKAFGYDWKPTFSADEVDARDLISKLASADEPLLAVARFLLGGLIFSSFAQASDTTHYVQPKRSEMLLGLIDAASAAEGPRRRDEDEVFRRATAAFGDANAKVERLKRIPPVLPHLIEKHQPKHVRELLERALEFRNSDMGRRYRDAFDAIRRDGVAARQMEDLSDRARTDASQLLAPYTTDPAKIGGMKVTAKLAHLVGSVESSFVLRLPTAVRIWLNANVQGRTIRKIFRRMWVGADSYRDLSAKLIPIWTRS